MRKLRHLILILIALSLGSCHSSKRISANSKKDQTLRLALEIGINSLDPRYGVDFPTIYVTKMLFEGLMILGQDGSVELGLAEKYTLSEDRKTYTFRLRPSFWSNGDPVTAHDFAYSWRCIIDPSRNTLGKQNFYLIKNVKAIIEHGLPIEEAGIHVIDDNTIQVELEHPAPYFLELLTSSSFLPINANYDQKHNNWANTDGPKFVCNGPFTLERHLVENEILVTKNPHYWDESSIKLKHIHIGITRDLTTQLSLFEKGQLNWLGSPLSFIPSDALEDLQKKGKVNFAPAMYTKWLAFNTDAFPFSNQKMRRAFSIAVNRKNIVKHLLQSEEIPATGVLPPKLSTQSAPFFKDNDQGQAVRLFEEALEELGLTRDQLPIITILHSSVGNTSIVMQEVLEQLISVFNIRIRLEQQDFKTVFSSMQQGNYQIGMLGWRSWINDPIYVLQAFRERIDTLNCTNWENEDYKELLRLSDDEINPKKRMEYFNQAEVLLMEHMPLIPLYHHSYEYCIDPKLKHMSKDLDHIDFRWDYFEE